MDRNRLKRARCEGPISSEEPSLDIESPNFVHQSFPSLSIPLQPFASAGQHSESSATYFSWPGSCQISDAAQERANYFSNLQKGLLPQIVGRLPQGQQATTLLDLMTIRAFHSKILRCYSLGTAVGFRIRNGVLTNIPAILVFVSRKVRRQWLNPGQCLPTALEGPGGVWCEVDVLEFSHFGAPECSPKEQLYDKIMDDLRGNDPCIGSGSQVASQEIFGTMSAIVRSQTGSRQVGFLTNRHVAVDLDYPSQKMFHPLPPNLGPGVYLGAVERATSYITDYLWYGIFAGSNPETFVRADGAFIPFVDGFNISTIRTSVKGVGEIGEVKHLDLQSPISSLLGKRVMKVGRSSGLTYGVVLAYGLEYNDEKGVCFLNDILVVGENKETFDLEGDSGSLIMLVGEKGEKPTPIGIIWGGASNRGRLKSKVGCAPENWTIGVDLGRLLNILDLDLITTTRGLKEAMREQMVATATTINAALRDSFSHDEPLLDLQIHSHILPNGLSGPNICSTGLNLEDGPDISPNAERQFIPGFVKQSPLHSIDQTKMKVEVLENLSAMRNGTDEDLCVSLQLGDNELKRRQSRVSSSSGESNKNKLEL